MYNVLRLPQRRLFCQELSCSDLILELPHQPRHVLAEAFHGLDSLRVIIHLAGLSPDADVPVARSRDDHLINREKIIERVEYMDRARPPDSDYGRADLPPVQAAVRAPYHAASLDQRLHTRGYVGEIGRRPEQDSFGRIHFSDAFIDNVLFNGALLVLFLKTLKTPDTPLDLLSRERIDLRLDPLGLQFIEHEVQEDRGVPVLSGAAVECDDFHTVLLMGNCFSYSLSWYWLHPVLNHSLRYNTKMNY